MPTKDSRFIHAVSTGTMIRFFGVLLGLALLYFIRDVIFSLIFAVIVASAVEPGIEWLKGRKIPRILSVVLMYCAIAVIFALVVYLFFPLLWDELNALSVAYPHIQKGVLFEIQRWGIFPSNALVDDLAPSLFRAPTEYLGKLNSGFFDFASTAFGGIFSFILIIVFSFYLAAQEKGIDAFLKIITPLAYEPYVADLWERSQRKLGRWLRTQLLLGAIVGIFIFFGLTFLNVPHAFFFAIIAGMFEIIPIVGPILAAVPAVTTAFFMSPFLGLAVTVFYLFVQQTESHVIVPVVMKKAVGLSPLVVLLALLVGGKIGGIFGILLAVPLTAVAAELLNDFDKKKRALIPE